MTGLIAFIIGSLSNAVRGGVLKNFDVSWYDRVDPYDKIQQPILFGIFTYFVTQNWITALFMIAQMWAGQQMGWGSYVGATIGANKAMPEQPWIDRIIAPLSSAPIFWGMAGLTLRGLFWGLMLSVSITAISSDSLSYGLSFWPILIGATMGIVYASVGNLVRITAPLGGWKSYTGWAVSEFPFGGLIWLSTVL